MGIKDEELRPLGAGFGGFMCALGGYFLLLPLRDEAGVALGTDKLPRLFLASLLLTFLAAPLASAFLSRSPAREQGLRLLFRALSLSVLGFAVLYLAAGTPQPPPPLVMPRVGAAADAALLQQTERRLLAPPPGALELTGSQAAVRVAFYLWVSLLNLVAVSSLWARSADVFSPEAAGRLFGLLGAGATLGQLLGSLAARALAAAPLLRGTTTHGAPPGPSLLPLLASAAALEAAGRLAGAYRAARPAGGGAAAAGDAKTVEAEGGGAQALQASTSGASLTAKGGSAAAKSGGGGGGSAEGGAAQPGDGITAAGMAAAARRAWGGAVGRGGLADQVVRRTLEGYRLIRASPYLLHLCGYLGLNYVASSFFYFEKTLVVARVPDAAKRTAWFATINSTSAFFILGLQLLATGRVLRRVGLPVALAVLPSAAALLMAVIAVWPQPGTVAGAEVARKVLAYALARPARESLFTVVGREEKYKAKIFMDTVVQRMGDTLAAAAFQALVPALGFGPSGMAVACVPVCALWAATAFRLGQRQQRLAASAAAGKPPQQ